MQHRPARTRGSNSQPPIWFLPVGSPSAVVDRTFPKLPCGLAARPISSMTRRFIWPAWLICCPRLDGPSDQRQGGRSDQDRCGLTVLRRRRALRPAGQARPRPRRQGDQRRRRHPRPAGGTDLRGRQDQSGGGGGGDAEADRARRRAGGGRADHLAEPQRHGARGREARRRRCSMPPTTKAASAAATSSCSAPFPTRSWRRSCPT